MKIVIFGLSITSSWGNGHATTFRALCRALHDRGHKIVFYERDVEWYASNRDLPEPSYCDLRLYDRWPNASPRAREDLADCDVAVVGSYFPDGLHAIGEVLNSAAPVKAFYDIDTPITVAQLRAGDASYLKRSQIPGFDLYFSFTGGPMLNELESKFAARRAVPLYCSFDSKQHDRRKKYRRYTCDMSYMGTYASDRQAKLEMLLCEAARQLPDAKFIVAGPQYPKGTRWPKNVRRIIHLSPRWHAGLYSSSRVVLNLTRKDMVEAGYSPSVRLFEAAACGAAIVSDTWPGLETFLEPGKEILLAENAIDVLGHLRADPDELTAIGSRARARVLEEHTAEKRAEQFEMYVSTAKYRSEDLAGTFRDWQS